MLACVALLLAGWSWSLDEAQQHLRAGDVLLAANALERAIELNPEDREAVLLLSALYEELADKPNAERVGKLRDGLEPDASSRAFARLGVQMARRTKRLLQRSPSPAQWARLVKLGPIADPGPPPQPLIAPGVEKPVNGACFTSFKPEHCDVHGQPGVTLRAARCDAAPTDAAVEAIALGSAALETLSSVYGNTWPGTRPLERTAKVVARVDADGDGTEDVLVEVEIAGDDPTYDASTVSVTPPRCTRTFVVSGTSVTLAGNEWCGKQAAQRFRGLAISPAARAPLLWMETSDDQSVAVEAITWDGAGYARALIGCSGPR